MAKRKLSKEGRRKRMGLGYSFLGKPEILEPPKTLSEKQKAEELEKERQEALKKRLKKEKEKRKGRTAEAVDEAIRFVLSEQEEEGPFQCPLCKHEPFETRELLSRHIKKAHPKTVQERAEKIQERRFQEEEYNRQQTRRRGALLRLRRKRLGSR